MKAIATMILVTLTALSSAYAQNSQTLSCKNVSYNISPKLTQFFASSNFNSSEEIQIVWLASNPRTNEPYALNSAELNSMVPRFKKVVEWAYSTPTLGYVGSNIFEAIGSVYITVKSSNRAQVKKLICSMPSYALFSAAYNSEFTIN